MSDDSDDDLLAKPAFAKSRVDRTKEKERKRQENLMNELDRTSKEELEGMVRVRQMQAECATKQTAFENMDFSEAVDDRKEIRRKRDFSKFRMMKSMRRGCGHSGVVVVVAAWWPQHGVVLAAAWWRGVAEVGRATAPLMESDGSGALCGA